MTAPRLPLPLLVAVALAAAASAQVPLTLTGPDDAPLPEETEAYLFEREGTAPAHFADSQEPEEGWDSRPIGPVGAAGRTSGTVVPTEGSGRTYLVLALTPDGERYASFVRIGELAPGFDEVASGTMVMRPLSDGAEDTAQQLAGLLDEARPPTPQVLRSDTTKVDTTSTVSGDGWGVPGWVWVVATLAVLAGIAFWRREDIADLIYKLKTGRSRTVPSSNDTRASGANAFGRANHPDKMRDSDRHEIRVLRQEVDHLKAQVLTLTGRLDAAESSTRQQAAASRVNESLSAEPDKSKAKRKNRGGGSVTRPPKKASVEDQIGEAFVGWCRSNPPRVDRARSFEDHLRGQTTETGLTVETVRREHNATRPHYASQVQSGTEYWLVQAQGNAYLLPRPSYGMFNHIAPDSFETPGSQPVPTDVQSCAPARLRAEGNGWTIAERGTLQ